MLWDSSMLTVWAAGCIVTVVVAYILLEKWY